VGNDKCVCPGLVNPQLPCRHIGLPLQLILSVYFRPPTYGVFDLNVQVESIMGGMGITGKSKIKPPRDPRDPRGLLFLNIQVKHA